MAKNRITEVSHKGYKLKQVLPHGTVMLTDHIGLIIAWYDQEPMSEQAMKDRIDKYISDQQFLAGLFTEGSKE